MLGWWTRQAGSAQTLTDLSALAAVHDDGLGHLVAGLLVSWQLALAPLALAFLISNSTY